MRNVIRKENIIAGGECKQECAKPEKRSCVWNVTLNMVNTGDVYLMDQVS